MDKPLKIGIIGDFDPNLVSHVATNESINHAVSALSVSLDYSWIPTQALDDGCNHTILDQFHGFGAAQVARIEAWKVPSDPSSSPVKGAGHSLGREGVFNILW